MTKAKAAALFGGAAVTAWAIARRRQDDVGHPVHHTGRAARNARVAGLGAKVGTSYAVHQARRVFASAPVSGGPVSGGPVSGGPLSTVASVPPSVPTEPSGLAPSVAGPSVPPSVSPPMVLSSPPQ